MSPLDDELRRALTQRAALLEPATDPLDGIETRARGIRRRRSLAAVAGAALAVAAIAVSVPLLSGDRPTGAPDQYATSTPDSVSAPGALDPAHPWAFRGTPLDQGTLDTFTREWQAMYPGGTFTPLWAQVWEPSQQLEVVFVGSANGDHFVGWVTAREGGPDFDVVQPYDRERSYLVFTAEGDEGVTRLYVVGAPGAELSYAQDGTHFTSMAEPAPSVGVVPLEGNTSRARIRVVSGGFTYEEDVSNSAPDARSTPGNALDWETRGTPSGSPSVEDLKSAFAHARGREGSVVYHPLFVGDTDSGVRFTLGQAWFEGDDAALLVSYATGGTGGPELFVGQAVDPLTWGVAYLVGSLPGTSTDLLVVVPRPGIGEVAYSPDATSRFEAKASGRSDLNGVALIERSTTASDDRLKVLDGDGNLDNPLYEGPVAPLLCGVKECG